MTEIEGQQTIINQLDATKLLDIKVSVAKYLSETNGIPYGKALCLVATSEKLSAVIQSIIEK